jgi:predicted amidophosphoribosyltransferase
MEYVLKKEVKEKQSSKSKKSRSKIDKQIVIENREKIKGKKVLVVDDVYTTGATLYKAIS